MEASARKVAGRSGHREGEIVLYMARGKEKERENHHSFGAGGGCPERSEKRWGGEFDAAVGHVQISTMPRVVCDESLEFAAGRRITAAVSHEDHRHAPRPLLADARRPAHDPSPSSALGAGPTIRK